jgi:hypothetical protein
MSDVWVKVSAQPIRKSIGLLKFSSSILVLSGGVWVERLDVRVFPFHGVGWHCSCVGPLSRLQGSTQVIFSQIRLQCDQNATGHRCPRIFGGNVTILSVNRRQRSNSGSELFPVEF